MGIEPPVMDREEIERVLCQIAEVEAARVVSENGGAAITELHVLANSQKAPRQIVRDIESLLMARFGINIDHKKISVAQISGHNGSHVKTVGRMRIGNIKFEATGHEALYEVILIHEDAESVGAAKGTASQSGRLRLAALATLDAAARCMTNQMVFALDHVAIVPAGDAKVAVACITAISRAGEEKHSGSAIVKASEVDAVVKGTLSAINRHVAFKRN